MSNNPSVCCTYRLIWGFTSCDVSASEALDGRVILFLDLAPTSPTGASCGLPRVTTAQVRNGYRARCFDLCLTVDMHLNQPTMALTVHSFEQPS